VKISYSVCLFFCCRFFDALSEFSVLFFGSFYSLFGFTQDLIKEAEKEENVYLFSLKEF